MSAACDALVAEVLAMDPEQVKDLCGRLAMGFAAKAEALYDKNPEEHGLLAQPYADLSDLFQDCSMVFDTDLRPVDMEEPVIVTSPTGAKAVASTAISPWGKR